jgi:hypothetical protein
MGLSHPQRRGRHALRGLFAVGTIPATSKTRAQPMHCSGHLTTAVVRFPDLFQIDYVEADGVFALEFLAGELANAARGSARPRVPQARTDC